MRGLPFNPRRFTNIAYLQELTRLNGDQQSQQQQGEAVRLRRGRVTADFAPEGDDEV